MAPEVQTKVMEQATDEQLVEVLKKQLATVEAVIPSELSTTDPANISQELEISNTTDELAKQAVVADSISYVVSKLSPVVSEILGFKKKESLKACYYKGKSCSDE